MAHKTEAATPKVEPTAHVSWPKEGFKVTAGEGLLAYGKRCRVVIEGEVTGYSMHDYGCSLDLKPKSIRVEGLEGAKGDKSLVDMVLEMKPTKKGG